jgi:hypothetical protein
MWRSRSTAASCQATCRTADCPLLYRVLTVKELPSRLFFAPVQSFREFNPGNGVNKRSKLLIRVIGTESLEPPRNLRSKFGELLRKCWVFQERFHHVLGGCHGEGWSNLFAC